jgi:hypothetical protein
MTDTAELDARLQRLLARRGALSSSFGALGEWLTDAGRHLTHADTGRLTEWGTHALGLVLDALLQYGRSSGAVPDGIVEWAERILVPALLGPSVVLSPAETQLVRALVQLLLQIRRAVPRSVAPPDAPLQ